MNLFIWLIFGVISGLIAHLVDPADTGSGLLGTMILGVLGAILGGLVANLVIGVGVTGFSLTSFVISILGSLLLLFIQRAVRRT